MLNYLLRRRHREQEAQQAFVDKAIYDGAYRYAAAAQTMLSTFRREQADRFSGDWQGFDAAQKFLNHANEELRRMLLYRCAYLALAAASPKNAKKGGLISLLSHACWQLVHFSKKSEANGVAHEERMHDARSTQSDAHSEFSALLRD
jgi:hypothetical protein